MPDVIKVPTSETTPQIVQNTAANPWTVEPLYPNINGTTAVTSITSSSPPSITTRSGQFGGIAGTASFNFPAGALGGTVTGVKVVTDSKITSAQPSFFDCGFTTSGATTLATAANTATLSFTPVDTNPHTYEIPLTSTQIAAFNWSNAFQMQFTYRETSWGLLSCWTGRVNVVVTVTYPTPTVAPSAPSALTFSVVKPTSLTLSWTDTNTSTGASDSFSVYRYVTSNGAGTAVLVGSPTNPTFFDSGLSASTGYSYYVTGTNTLGTSPASATAAQATPAPPVPQQPTGLSITNIAATNLTINFNDTPGVATTPTAWDIYYWGEDTGPSTTMMMTALATPGATSYARVLSNLSVGVLYSMYIIARNDYFSAAPTATITGRTTVPTAVAYAMQKRHVGKRK